MFCFGLEFLSAFLLYEEEMRTPQMSSTYYDRSLISSHLQDIRYAVEKSFFMHIYQLIANEAKRNTFDFFYSSSMKL